MNSIYIKACRWNRYEWEREKYTGTHTISELKKAMERASCGGLKEFCVETADGKTYYMDDLNEQFAIDYWGGEA